MEKQNKGELSMMSEASLMSECDFDIKNKVQVKKIDLEIGEDNNEDID